MDFFFNRGNPINFTVPILEVKQCKLLFVASHLETSSRQPSILVAIGDRLIPVAVLKGTCLSCATKLSSVACLRLLQFMSLSQAKINGLLSLKVVSAPYK